MDINKLKELLGNTKAVYVKTQREFNSLKRIKYIEYQSKECGENGGLVACYGGLDGVFYANFPDTLRGDTIQEDIRFWARSHQHKTIVPFSSIFKTEIKYNKE